MGIYYEYAVVHGRVLVWWRDDGGSEHHRWLEGSVAEALIETSSGLDHAMQTALRAAVAPQA